MAQQHDHDSLGHASHDHGSHAHVAHGHASHEHGSMDTTAHEKTFAGFVTVATRTAIVVIVALVFMALVNA